MSVVVVGCNQRSLRLDMLESMAIGDESLPKALADLSRREHVGEVVVVSTCQRTEIYADTTRFHGAAGDLRTFLADWSGHPPEAFVDGLYEYFDERAVEHLFRLSAGLESAVLGEGEILRQVRSAWEAARGEGTVGTSLGAAFRMAVEAGKRVRAETSISRGTTSLSHTAVMLAGRHLAAGAASPLGGGQGPPCPGAETLRGRKALVLGAGEMGSAVAALLSGGPGIGAVLIANRTAARAAAVASATGATAVDWAGVPAVLAHGEVDLVVAATSATSPVLGVDDLDAGRPVVVVDLGRPRNVAPAAGTLAGVTLLDMDDLEAHARAARAGREAAIPAAEQIVAEELHRFSGHSAAREVAPIVAALHQRGEAIRRAELDRLAPRLSGLEPSQRRAVEALTRGIVAKLLHDPTVNVKAAAGDDRGARLAATLAELWDLPGS